MVTSVHCFEVPKWIHLQILDFRSKDVFNHQSLLKILDWVSVKSNQCQSLRNSSCALDSAREKILLVSYAGGDPIISLLLEHIFSYFHL